MKFSLFLGVTMTKTKMDRYLLAAMGCTHIIPQNTQKEASMPQSVFPQNCRSVTLSRGYQSSHNVWVETQSKNLVGTGKRIYGRIQDTGCNYVIEGWNMNHEWVRIPCRRLIDAQMLLAKVMRKETFDWLRLFESFDNGQ